MTCVGGGSVVVHDARMRADMRKMFMDHHDFSFDQVFDEHCGNDTVYAAAAEPLVRAAGAGGCATAMMFGQTGSGKTYTMGAIYRRAAADLFKWVERNNPEAVVSVSFVEVAGTACRDMLNDGAAVVLRTAADGQVVLTGVVEAGAYDAQELLQHIETATKSRAS
eukprot:SAG31_NODE_11682_length_1007_cov_1.026432_1_plen_164_part_10